MYSNDDSRLTLTIIQQAKIFCFSYLYFICILKALKTFPQKLLKIVSELSLYSHLGKMYYKVY